MPAQRLNILSTVVGGKGPTLVEIVRSDDKSSCRNIVFGKHKMDEICSE